MNLNKIKEKISKYKILFVIIVSYALVIALFLATFITIYVISQNAFRSYFDYNASVVADNISENYDRNVEKRNTGVVNAILLDTEIQKNVKEIMEGNTSYECLLKVKRQLWKILVDEEYLSDALIYIENHNMIVGSVGFCSTEQYYVAYAQETFKTYDEFLKFLKETESPAILYSEKTMQSFSRVRYNIYKEDEEVGKIILINDVEKFLKPFKDAQSDVVIVQDGKIVATTDVELASSFLDAKYFENNIYETDGKLAYRSSMSDGRRKCFYVMDMERMQTANKNYRIFVTIACVVCLLLCIGVCIIFMFFHYTPVKKFADFIKTRNKDNGNNYSYQIFSDAANYIETSEKISEKEIGEKEKNLSEIYLEQWLLYKKIPKKNALKIPEGQKCALVVLKAEKYEQIFFEQVYEEKSLKLEMANFILTNVFDEEVHKGFSDAVKCKINDLLVWMVVFDEDLDWKKSLRETLEYIEGFVKKEFNISFECYKGDARESTDKILEDFDVIMVNIKQKEEKLTPETFSLLEEKEKKAIYYFPETIKKQLYDSIENGNAKSSAIIIDNLLKYNIETMRYGANNLKALATEIYNTVIIRLGCFDVGVERLFAENRLGKDIIMCESVMEIDKALRKFVESMCSFVMSKKEQNDSVYNKTRRFVYQNYKNPQLSSVTIADELGLSRDYFLSIFKKESGMKIADYIHQIRVEEACKILKKTSHSISEVASMVGYTNTKTFSRVFCKIMGVTPGVYRESKN